MIKLRKIEKPPTTIERLKELAQLNPKVHLSDRQADEIEKWLMWAYTKLS